MQQARQRDLRRVRAARRLLRAGVVAALALPASVPLASVLRAAPEPVVTAAGALSVPPRAAAPTPASRSTSRTAPAVRRVVGLGDSVPAASACGCTGYVGLLARRLGDGVASTNLSVPGQTSDGLVAQLTSGDVRAALADADVVVVTIGANDVEASDPGDCDDLGDPAGCYDDQLTALEQNLDRIASTVGALATRPGARVLLTGYWNVFRDGAVGRAEGTDYVRIADAVTREVNQRIAAAASAHGATYVDLVAPFRGTDGSRDATPLLAADGDHPDAAGHAVIAEALAAAL